ncbi:MAG: hypothetical protein OXJ52_01810 [Oligoflexia bacterium]|nr:hypothetical protein [Oligoflexia bacterium]
MELKEIFKEYPLFHKWSAKKKLNSTDLSILTEFKNSSSFRALIEWIEKHPVSHSEGKQILELGGELILMNQSIQAILQKHKQAKALIADFKKLRFPIYTQKQEEKTKIIKKLKLEPALKAVWRQDKDRGVLSIQFQSFSLKDLKQKIKKLEAVYKQLNEEKEKLFSTPT